MVKGINNKAVKVELRAGQFQSPGWNAGEVEE